MPHRFAAGRALHYAHLADIMMKFATVANRIDYDNISLNSIKREKFDINAFLEIYWNRQDRIQLNPHDFYEYGMMQNASLVVPSGDESSYVIDWSLNIERNSATTIQRLQVIPYAAGRMLWGGADMIQHLFPDPPGGGQQNDIPANDKIHSLSGSAVFTASGSTFDAGLIAVGNHKTGGSFAGSKIDASEVQVIVRKSVR